MLMTQHPTKREKILHLLYTEVLGNTNLKWFNDNSMKAIPGKSLVVNAKNFYKLKQTIT